MTLQGNWMSSSLALSAIEEECSIHSGYGSQLVLGLSCVMCHLTILPANLSDFWPPIPSHGSSLHPRNCIKTACAMSHNTRNNINEDKCFYYNTHRGIQKHRDVWNLVCLIYTSWINPNVQYQQPTTHTKSTIGATSVPRVLIHSLPPRYQGDPHATGTSGRETLGGWTPGEWSSPAYEPSSGRSTSRWKVCQTTTDSGIVLHCLTGGLHLHRPGILQHTDRGCARHFWLYARFGNLWPYRQSGRWWASDGQTDLRVLQRQQHFIIV